MNITQNEHNLKRLIKNARISDKLKRRIRLRFRVVVVVGNESCYVLPTTNRPCFAPMPVQCIRGFTINTVTYRTVTIPSVQWYKQVVLNGNGRVALALSRAVLFVRGGTSGTRTAVVSFRTTTRFSLLDNRS